MLGMLIALGVSIRVGGVVMAMAMFLGAGIRAAVPSAVVPSLVCRTRGIDVALYAGLGVVLLACVLAVKL